MIPSSQLLTAPNQLVDMLGQNQTKIIDTRSTSAYLTNHIPGAINIPEIFTFICEENSGNVNGMADFFKNKFENMGIHPNDQIVIYEDALDNGYGQSCRGWFLFNLFGHQGPVSVLHGGLKAWIKSNYPVETQVPGYEPSSYPLRCNYDLLITKGQMLQAIADPSVAIVDVRDYAEWVGANSSPYGYDFCPRKGRIPTARWMEWYKVMTRNKGIPWFKDNDEILKTCSESGIPLDKTLILYCFKGARTSNAMLALTKAGLRVKNYFNSWNEWSRDLTLPINEGYPQDED